jgi:uncharacterized protein YjiS (DUF1127 family)
MQNVLRYAILPRPKPARWWPAIRSTLALWRDRSRTRQYLARLDSRGLADIGITRAEQQRECAKPAWRP